MKSRCCAVIVAIGILSSAAIQAAPDVTGELGIGIGAVKNKDGGMGYDSNGGINGADTRANADIDLTAVLSFQSSDIQLGLATSRFETADNHLHQDDATKYTADLSLHYLYKLDDYRVGAFIGAGKHDDYGDSDEPMKYRFFGLEVQRMLENGDVFVQVGKLDSEDEYNEGTQDAPFVRVGGTYLVNQDWSVGGSIAHAAGDKYDNNYDNEIWAVNLGVERKLSDNITGFASYELDRIGYEDGDKYGDVFHTVMVGVKIGFGGKSSRSKVMSMPEFGRWVAFNANEIE